MWHMLTVTVIVLFLIVLVYPLSFVGLHTVCKIKYYTRYYVFDRLYIIVSTKPFIIVHVYLNLVFNFLYHI